MTVITMNERQRRHVLGYLAATCDDLHGRPALLPSRRGERERLQFCKVLRYSKMWNACDEAQLARAAKTWHSHFARLKAPGSTSRCTPRNSSLQRSSLATLPSS